MGESAEVIRNNIYFDEVRGEPFSMRFQRACDCKQIVDLIDRWRETRMALQIDQVTYRQLNHWEENGLLKCQRENSTGWRRFTPVENLWLFVLVELRRFGLSLDQIEKAMPFFFEKRGSLFIIEFYVLCALVYQEQVFFIILPSQSEFLNYDQYRLSLETKLLEQHICLNLSSQIERFFTGFTVEMSFTETVTDEQYQILKALKCNPFEKMTIYKEKEKLTRFETQKTFPNTTPLKALIENQPDTEVITKRRNGRVTSIKRKVTKKFNAQG